MSISWHQQATLYGIDVKASFFDANKVNSEHELVRRVLPFFTTAHPKTIFTESDRKNFYCEELVAQPDAVFEHGNGLISVEYKSVGGRDHDPAEWQQNIRLKDMLQCLLGGYSVAQTYKKPTACVLRYHNVCYFLIPEFSVMHTILSLIPMAKSYYSEKSRVSSSQLAQFSIDKIRSHYSSQNDAKSIAGRTAHEVLLKR